MRQHFERFLARPDITEHTRQKYYYRLRHFVELHGRKDPHDITTHDMSAFIDSKPDLANASKALLRAAFHAFMAFCGVDPNPAAALPRWSDIPRRIHLPNDNDVKTVMATAVSMSHSQHPPAVRDALIFALAVVSGNRRGELHNLPIADLLDALRQPEAGGLYRVYTNGKTGEAIMRFAEYHVPMIDRYLALRPQTTSPYAFLNLSPKHPRYGLQLSLVGINRVRNKLCAAAGVDLITYQELRRRLATKIARATNPTIAAQALNHSKHSGERVIRLFYYDPDKTAVDEQIQAAFNF